MPALLATLVTLATQLFTTYAVEARPYAMVSCAVAWALVAWQRVEEDRRFTVPLALLLCVGVSALLRGPPDPTRLLPRPGFSSEPVICSWPS